MTNEIEQLSEQLYFSDIEELVSSGHSVKIPIQGNSMYPFLIEGRDHVSIKKDGTISKGDIILVKTPEHQYILHRVYNISHDKYILMGDRNLHILEVCMKKNIIGKVYEIERNGKKINPYSFSEKIKATVWRTLRPVRRYLINLLSVINDDLKKEN